MPLPVTSGVAAVDSFDRVHTFALLVLRWRIPAKTGLTGAVDDSLEDPLLLPRFFLVSSLSVSLSGIVAVFFRLMSIRLRRSVVTPSFT